MEPSNPLGDCDNSAPFPPPRSVTGKLSFSQRRAQPRGTKQIHLVEGDKNMRNIDQPLPGDVVKKARKLKSRPDLTRQRSNYFEDAFSVTEVNPAKERVRSEAIVMAEVRTNVIISDEFTFITELSYHLSTRYQRPMSSIVVTLHHGACMLFGGTFDPAYTMSIYALPSQLQATTNKRNAALIQRHMDGSLGVHPTRGFLRFIPTKEDYTAWKGKTLAGEIDDLGKSCAGSQADDTVSVSSTKARTKKPINARSFNTLKMAFAGEGPTLEPTPPTSGERTPPETSLPPVPQIPELDPVAVEKRAKRKKSFVATIFGRSGSRVERSPPLPRRDRE